MKSADKIFEIREGAFFIVKGDPNLYSAERVATTTVTWHVKVNGCRIGHVYSFGSHLRVSIDLFGRNTKIIIPTEEIEVYERA